ncbi:MAG TPA: hypothetical protein PKH10_07330 [bacterium]|nr:hypothetical protein [bacterium]
MKVSRLFFAVACVILLAACGDNATNTVPDNAATDNAVPDETVNDEIAVDDIPVIDETPDEDEAEDTAPVEFDVCCGDEATDDMSDDLVDEDTEQPDEGHPLLDPFVGTWAEKLVLKSNTHTGIGDVPSTTTRYKLGHISIENGELKIEQKICKIDNTTVDPISGEGHTIFYQPFCDIYWYWRPGELSNPKPDITVTDNGGTITFVENRSWELRGMHKMDNVETDLMPTAADDARIFDHDADDKPAFTIGFTSSLIKGDIYFTQRLSHELTGTVVSPGRIEGSVNWTDSQYTVDSTNPTLKGQKESTILNDQSTFIYVKVADAFTCEEVYGQKDTLFAN